NRGFRDVLEIRRHARPDAYNLRLEMAPPLVPRDLRLEVNARLDHEGNVRVPVDEAEVAAVVRRLRAAGVTSVAVAFLHSYARPAEEERVAAVIRREHPDAYITCSAAVCPEFREYERTSTAVVNAAVMPLVDAYLNNLEGRLRGQGYARDLYIMQSNGGMMTAPDIRRFPVNIIESGPAAGVIASAAIGRATGRGNLLSFDMGGTTAKAALIHGGQIELTTEYEVGGTGHGAQGAGGYGGGYPIRLPFMDIVEVGAGGGSIAWIDVAGALRVGPISAGAEPGPVCYGRGGTEPTTTDANLALGRLSADYFLGGDMRLDPDAVQRSIGERIARPLGMTVEQAASGIVEVSNALMVRALRRVSVQRGRHPGDYSLVAFGGAGPLHACSLAEDLGVAEVIVPPLPGVASAIGLLGCDIRHDYRRAFFGPLAMADGAAMNRVIAELATEGRAAMRRSGLAESAIVVTPAAELRYVGQAYELRVELPALHLDPSGLAEAARRFHAEHLRRYTYQMPERGIEMVSLRVTVIGQVEKPATAALPTAVRPVAPKAWRPVHFRAAGMVRCPVFERGDLRVGDAIVGPAIIEQRDSTTVVSSTWRVTPDGHGHLIITRANV
ncbi:MAG: hydantoinase/oxoprolinase family protein, partial [Alphaproteobacteria bacterium]|nr:hydantoinase/oxoprolinase family protein [Alphaproteobacteria bacterium]